MTNEDRKAALLRLGSTLSKHGGFYTGFETCLEILWPAIEKLDGIAFCNGWDKHHLGADDYKDPGVEMARRIIDSLQETAQESIAALDERLKG